MFKCFKHHISILFIILALHVIVVCINVREVKFELQ